MGNFEPFKYIWNDDENVIEKHMLWTIKFIKTKICFIHTYMCATATQSAAAPQPPSLMRGFILNAKKEYTILSIKLTFIISAKCHTRFQCFSQEFYHKSIDVSIINFYIYL